MNVQHKYKSGLNAAQSFEHGVPKRFTIFITAFGWTLISILIFGRSIYLLLNYHDYLLLKVVGSLIAGLLFYLLLFFKISFRHSRITISLRNDGPRSFSSFDVKRDILITVIAIIGFLLRVLGIVSLENISILYIATGIPLLLSTLRYYYYGTFYDEVIHHKDG
jgi:hypothetical protein